MTVGVAVDVLVSDGVPVCVDEAVILPVGDAVMVAVAVLTGVAPADWVVDGDPEAVCVELGEDVHVPLKEGVSVLDRLSVVLGVEELVSDGVWVPDWVPLFVGVTAAVCVTV